MYTKLDRSNTSKIQHGTESPGVNTRGNVFVKDGTATLYAKDSSLGWFSVGGSGGGGGIGVFEGGSASGSAQRIDQSLDALGVSSFLMGTGSSNTADADFSFVFGQTCSSASSWSTSIGYLNSIGSSSNGATCIGRMNTIESLSGSSVCLGYSNTVGSSSCFSAGQANVISSGSPWGIAIGYNNVFSGACSGAVAIGRGNQITTSTSCSVFGYLNNITSSNYSFIAGSQNIINGQGHAIFGSTNSILAGTYSLVSGDSNLFNNISGSIIIGSTNTDDDSHSIENSLIVGSGNSISDSRTFVFGTGNISASNYSFLFGNSNENTGNYNSIFGNSIVVDGNSSGAIGTSNNCYGNGNFTTGIMNIVGNSGTESFYTTVFGYDNEVYGSVGSFSFGSSNLSTSDYSFCSGSGNMAVASNYAFVFGKDNTSNNAEHSIVFGNGNVSSVLTNINPEYSLVRGRESMAIWPGAHWFSGGSIGSGVGTTQCMSNMPLATQTIGNTTETMKFNIGDSTSPLYIPSGYAQAYRVILIASDLGTSGFQIWEFTIFASRSASYLFSGVTDTGEFAPKKTVGSLSGLSVSVTDDNANYVQINVNGDTGKTINWVANIHAGCSVETGYVAAS